MFSFKNIVLYKIILVINILTLELVICANITSKCIYKNTNKPGVCITIQNCKEALSDIEKGVQSCGIDNAIPKVCCSRFGEETSVAEEKCKDYSQTYEKIPDKEELLLSKINGGVPAKFGEFPHMALLGHKNHSVVSWFCGGSLISEKFVLTAGHCISGTTGLNVTMVQLGDIEIGSPFFITYSVRKVYKYPDYTPPSEYHDVGLVELADTVHFSANIIPACLPKTTDIASNLIVSGFGMTDTSGTNSQTLQWTNLNYVPINECIRIFKKHQKLPNGVLDEIQLCYGGGISGRDACQGDSGGPLQDFDYNLKLFRVIGVVSVGKLCGSSAPGIYSKVFFYKHWVESIVWKSEYENNILTNSMQPRISIAKEEVIYRKRTTAENCNGYSNEKLDGYNATGRKFPHMAAIGYADEQNLAWLCSGTLISENFVLTSAACSILQPKFVQLGDNNLYDSSSTRKVIKITKIYIHPKYKDPSLYNDIALLELALPVKFSPFIKPACLLTNTDNNSFQDFTTIVSGWDITEANGNFSKYLQDIEHQYYANCQPHHDPHPEYLPDGINSTSQLCFGTIIKSKNECDSLPGAPIQFYDSTTNLHRVIAVFSGWDSECGTGAPKISTKVATYIDWIEEIVWK